MKIDRLSEPWPSGRTEYTWARFTLETLCLEEFFLFVSDTSSLHLVPSDVFIARCLCNTGSRLYGNNLHKPCLKNYNAK